MYNKRKIHLIFSIIFFVLLAYIAINSFVNAMTINWLENEDLYDKITLYSWLIFAWSVFTILIIIANFYSNNKLKWIKIICLFALAILLLVLACIIKSQSDGSYSEDTVVVAAFSNYILSFVISLAYFIVSLIDTIFSCKEKKFLKTLPETQPKLAEIKENEVKANDKK